MAKRTQARFLDPLKSQLDAIGRAAQIVAQSREAAEQLRKSLPFMSLPTADQLRPGDAYSLAFGYEKARRLLDPALDPRRIRAAQRCSIILQMSLDGQPVRAIAAAVGLHPNYVVKIRARLRREEKLPPLRTP